MIEKQERREAGCIELSDKELLEKNLLSRGMQKAGFSYKKPMMESLLPQLQEKFKVAIDKVNDEKSKSKTTKKAARKNNRKPIKSAVESV